MKRHALFTVILASVFVFQAGYLRAQTLHVWEGTTFHQIGSKSTLPSLAIYELLDQVVETNSFQKEQAFTNYLEALHRILSQKEKGFGIAVNKFAFWEQDPDDVRIELRKVKFPVHPKFATGWTILKVALSQVGATWKLQRGLIQITPEDWSRDRGVAEVGPRELEGPLVKVLDDLAESTGMSIVVDQRVAKEAQSKVKAKLVNSVSLNTVLIMLTDMAGLSYVAIKGSFYVTSVENARRLQANQKPRPHKSR